MWWGFLVCLYPIGQLMTDVRSYENRDGLQDFNEGMRHVFNSLVFISKRLDASIGDYQLNYL